MGGGYLPFSGVIRLRNAKRSGNGEAKTKLKPELKLNPEPQPKTMVKVEALLTFEKIWEPNLGLS